MVHEIKRAGNATIASSPFRLFYGNPHPFTPNLGVINQIHQLSHPGAGFDHHATNVNRYRGLSHLHRNTRED